MSEISRRSFLKISARLAAVMGLSSTALPQIAEALEQIAAKAAPVIWLQAQSCTGCSVSLLNSDHPGPAEIITQYISLLFHSNISTTTGHQCMEVISKTVGDGGFFLAVEGSVPKGMPSACKMGDKTIGEQIIAASKKAKAVIAVGTCSSFGGIPAAENNPTGAISLPALFKNEGITTPLIMLPGCPIHPDWLVGTLVHLIKFGIPPVDDKGRPKMFYKKLIHDQCPRFTDYEREKFAKNFLEEGCLFKLGCIGALTYADCTMRQWNSGTNSCIRAGAPCIGCASENFAAKADFALYPRNIVTQPSKGKDS